MEVVITIYDSFMSGAKMSVSRKILFFYTYFCLFGRILVFVGECKFLRSNYYD